MTLKKLVRKVNLALGASFTAATLPRMTIREALGENAIPRHDHLMDSAREWHRRPFASTGQLSAKYCPAG